MGDAVVHGLENALLVVLLYLAPHEFIGRQELHLHVADAGIKSRGGKYEGDGEVLVCLLLANEPPSKLGHERVEQPD